MAQQIHSVRTGANWTSLEYGQLYLYTGMSSNINKSMYDTAEIISNIKVNLAYNYTISFLCVTQFLLLHKENIQLHYNPEDLNPQKTTVKRSRCTLD
jgi:hypothetical protein